MKTVDNLESLYPRGRNDRGKQRALDEETCLGLVRLREEMPDVTVPFIIKTMKKRNVVPPNTYLPLSTVYRFFHQHNLMRKCATVEDRRKYEAEMPNDIWQSDVLHGPKLIAGDKRRKTYPDSLYYGKARRWSSNNLKREHKTFRQNAGLSAHRRIRTITDDLCR
jgi:putative transposase